MAPDIAARAMAALHTGELEEAQTLASQLEKLRYSAYFEIQALIYLERRQRPLAIKVLREGVERAPSVWLLWQLLGNCLSDDSQFEEALRCYGRARALEIDADARASLMLNQATVLGRTERVGEALALLDSVSFDEVEDVQLEANLELLRLHLWASSHRCDDVGVRAAHVGEVLSAIEDARLDDRRAVSALWSRCGRAARARC